MDFLLRLRTTALVQASAESRKKAQLASLIGQCMNTSSESTQSTADCSEAQAGLQEANVPPLPHLLNQPMKVPLSGYLSPEQPHDKLQKATEQLQAALSHWETCRSQAAPTPSECPSTQSIPLQQVLSDATANTNSLAE